MDNSTAQTILILVDDAEMGNKLTQTIKMNLDLPVNLVSDSIEKWTPLTVEGVDAIIIASRKGPEKIQDHLIALNEQAPDAPILVFSDEVSLSASKELLDAGAWKVLDINSKARDMASGIQDLMEVAKKGHISGVSLPVALQMLELERKTCTLTVVSGEKKGLLFFKNGELIEAQTQGKKGLDAALEIASWTDVRLEFKNFCKTNKRGIDTPLAFILLEASRQKDEEGGEPLAAPEDDEKHFAAEAGSEELDESLIEGLDDIEFDIVESNEFDLDQAMKSGPLANDLQRIKKALARAIGPIADTVFRQHAINWAKDSEPTPENLNHLIDLLCVEIEDEDLILEFRKELGL